MEFVFFGLNRIELRHIFSEEHRNHDFYESCDYGFILDVKDE